MIYSEEVLLMWKLNVKHANVIKNRIIIRTTIGWKLKKNWENNAKK